MVLEDIDECNEMDNLCQNGRCSNTFGSFMCTCNDGYVIDDANAMCVDVDECAQDATICGVGECVNTDGGYSCVCPDGYVLLPGGRECVDMRKELCYMSYSTGECANAMTQPQTRMVCCCSMGAAWGKACEQCPAQGTRNHNIIQSNTIQSNPIL